MAYNLLSQTNKKPTVLAVHKQEKQRGMLVRRKDGKPWIDIPAVVRFVEESRLKETYSPICLSGVTLKEK